MSHSSTRIWSGANPLPAKLIDLIEPPAEFGS
jgi:hypothetical protein